MAVSGQILLAAHSFAPPSTIEPPAEEEAGAASGVTPVLELDTVILR